MKLNCNHLPDDEFHVSGFHKDGDVLGTMSLVDATPHNGLLVHMIGMDVPMMVIDSSVN
jgi:hypothetical protein